MIRIVLFGDKAGIKRLLKYFPKEAISGVVAAAIRPQYHKEVYSVAANAGIPFYIQPPKKSAEYVTFLRWLSCRKADLFFVNSYAMKLHKDMLSRSQLGGINLHGGLLPQYRGSNPIQWSIIRNEHKAGVTLHEITDVIDGGNIIANKEVPILFRDTWLDVRDRIKRAGDNLIEENLKDILAGNWRSVPQQRLLARSYRRRTPEDGVIDWSGSVLEIYNLIRALVKPLPGAFYSDNKGHKIVIDTYKSISEVAVLKYNFGCKTMSGKSVLLVPFVTGKYSNTEKEEQPMIAMPLKERSLYHDGFQDCLKLEKNAISSVSFEIRNQKSNEVVGYCGLRDYVWEKGTAEIFWNFRKSNAFPEPAKLETLRFLVTFAFTELELQQVQSKLPPRSHNDCDLLLKMGFQQEKRAGKGFPENAETEAVVMSMKREDYGSCYSSA